MMKIAVSACLLGARCRYDGVSKRCEELCSYLDKHTDNLEVVPICPEVAGGFKIPHPAHEIDASAKYLRVIDRQGNDHTDLFVKGAQKTVQRVTQAHCSGAILKAKSPSCGIGLVYDGTFTNKLTRGNGVAAELLMQAGIAVCDEHSFRDLLQPEIAEDL